MSEETRVATGTTGFFEMLGLCVSQLRRSRRELALWERRAAALCPPAIRPLALSSLRSKAFHSIGGAIYACAPTVPMHLRGDLTGTIVALQTVSDYLDTLVDRSGCSEPGIHENLHRSFVDGLDAGAPDSPDSACGAAYFDGFPLGYDGGYLDRLVRRVREGVLRLPAYPVVREAVLDLARLYSGMQSRKHADPETRETEMALWHRANCLDPVRWWEFGAAAGSTLAIFALLSLAADQMARVEAVARIRAAYFPDVCAFHILLDYLIDRDEDTAHGDLNFTRYYSSHDEMLESLCLFLERGREGLGLLTGAGFHQKVLSGLPALYLSDSKVERGGLGRIAREIIRRTGPDAARFYSTCRGLRRIGLL
ncbi:MAG: DUF2600 family protein [Ignavibacteriales bacterium]